MAWWMPVLQAIGLNAGKNLLTGQDPLKGTIEAGVTGGTIGNLTGNVIPGAKVAQSSVVPGSIESAGMTNVSGTFYNPEYFVGESLGMPIYSGGQGLLSNLGDEASAALSNISPQNMLGVASLLSQPDTSNYQQSAGTGGGVSRGNLGQSQPLSNVAVNRRKMNIWS